MKIMLIFLLGFGAAAYLFPILDSVASVILSGLEIIRGKASYKIAKINASIEDINQESNKVPIGFQVPLENDEDYDEDGG